VIQRNLIAASELQKISPSDKELVDLLLTADQEITFPKFMDLPAELRVKVEEYYIAGLQEKCDALLCPAQPPLARTCKMMMKEVLPLFYSNSHFAIAFCGYLGGPYLTDSSGRLVLDPKSNVFLNRIAPVDLAYIKRFPVLVGQEIIIRVTVSDYPALFDIVKRNAENGGSKADVIRAVIRLGKCILQQIFQTRVLTGFRLGVV
jgi:hypothetical protein